MLSMMFATMLHLSLYWILMYIFRLSTSQGAPGYFDFVVSVEIDYILFTPSTSAIGRAAVGVSVSVH